MKRVELLIKDSIYRQYMKYNLEEEMQPKFCQHNFGHHLDVARIAYILVLEHNDLNYFIKECHLSGKLAAKEIIYAAGLLHDIGKWKEYKEGVDHASYGASLAKDILERAFFNRDEINIISQAIFEHRNISLDMSFLGERLHRADNLSRICSECPDVGHCPKAECKEINVSGFEY